MKLILQDLAGQCSALCQAERLDVAIKSEEFSAYSHAETNPNMRSKEEQSASAMEALKSFDLKQFTRSLFTDRVKSDPDPYLLLLLAQQDLGEGREEQAMCLVEAAFSAFDQAIEDNGIKLVG